MIDASVAGETLTLLPERAVFWSRAQTLFVADAHFGKAAAFRAAGVYVPEATTAGMLDRLTRLIDATRARRVVFLGDFLHAREGRHPGTLASLRQWRAERANVEMLLLRGNHDRRAGDPPEELGIECLNGPLIEAPFAFAHHPTAVTGAYVLAGHVHPAVSLAGGGRQFARLPCFWMRSDIAVLPAFGEFTGLADISPGEGDRVFVVAGDRVIEKRAASVGS